MVSAVPGDRVARYKLGAASPRHRPGLSLLWLRCLVCVLPVSFAGVGCKSDLADALNQPVSIETEESDTEAPSPVGPDQPDASAPSQPQPEEAGAPVSDCTNLPCAVDGGGPDDQCPDNPDKTAPGACGCGELDEDADGDGVYDCEDGCPGDVEKTSPGVCGCGVADEDSDEDGSHDCEDDCPGDPDKVTLGVCGCGVADEDSDEDGSYDCEDDCPTDPEKTSPGVCGCGMADVDEDEDAVPDCVDECIGEPMLGSSSCGCVDEVNDADSDGTADCADDCATDPDKTQPGACGCGTPDADTDSDGALDCEEECPTDPLKVEPGICGCNEPELDTDGDDVPNCIDECPDDPTKIELGACGCGYSDSPGTDANPDCRDLEDALVHRYRFEDTGVTATDSVGSADGTVVGTTLDGSGSADLSVGPYVDLPNDVLSGFTNATFEVWVERGSLTDPFQRILDFGDSGTEGETGLGQSYIYLTPRTTPDKGNAIRLTYYGGEAGTEVALTGPSALALDATSHVACVFDDDGDMMQLYVDGVRIQQQAWPHALSQINAINNWLGRSQFMADPGFDGSIDEFRIYDVALDAAQIEYSFDSGPNPTFLD